MKHLIILVFSLCISVNLQAQQDELYKYDRIPDSFQRVFADVTADCATGIIQTSSGQYWGQTKDGILYGYGIFSNNQGGQWIGQYRNGECIFGILIDDRTVNVGSKTFYSLYDLHTGELFKIFTPTGVITPPPSIAKDYKFVSMTYANGDRYVGETYKGARHGYGIYYWSDGQFWYGQYRHNVRDGYGALFAGNEKIYTGKWFDNDKLRD